MTIATSNDVLAYYDTVSYTKIDIDRELRRAESSILRLLNEQWYKGFLKQNPQYTPQTLNFSLLSADEWREAVISYALAYNILPKISKEYGLDTFQEQAEYHDLWETTIRHRLEFGFTYDADDTTVRFVDADPQTDYIRVRQ